MKGPYSVSMYVIRDDEPFALVADGSGVTVAEIAGADLFIAVANAKHVCSVLNDYEAALNMFNLPEIGPGRIQEVRFDA